MDMKEMILARLQPAPGEEVYKQVTVNLPMEYLETMGEIAKAMSQASGSHVSRNMLIQDAIEAFIKEAEQTMSELGLSGLDEEPGMTMNQGQSM